MTPAHMVVFRMLKGAAVEPEPEIFPGSATLAAIGPGSATVATLGPARTTVSVVGPGNATVAPKTS